MKISKTTQVTKNKGATSSNDKGDLKMISIHPNFIEVIRDLFCENKFSISCLEVLSLRIYMQNPWKILSVRSKNWTKITKLRSYALCLARGNPMNKIYFLLFAFCSWVLAQLWYCYDYGFCVLVSVCAKQGLWEDFGESLFDLAEKQKLMHSRK